MEELKESQRLNVEKNRASVNSKGERSKHFDSEVEKDNVIEGAKASKHQTKRERLDMEEVIKERLRMKVDSGELTLASGGVALWSLEYEALNVGGYLPLSDPIRLLVLSPDSLESCHAPTTDTIHAASRDRSQNNKMAPLAIIFAPSLDCSLIDVIEVAHKMQADVALLYGGMQEREDGRRAYWSDVPPSGTAVLMELERSATSVLKKFKGAVISVSVKGGEAAAKEADREGGGGVSVSFESDQFVFMSWSDIRRLTDPASWPRDSRQRQRLYKKMGKVHEEGRWPERAKVIRESFEQAERIWDEWAKAHEELSLREEL